MKFDKEEFLIEIHTIPSWVKSGDDLMKFCKHLHYRLIQAKSVNSWYEKNIELTEEGELELLNIICDYDKTYNQDSSQFQPFSEIFTVENLS